MAKCNIELVLGHWLPQCTGRWREDKEKKLFVCTQCGAEYSNTSVNRLEVAVQNIHAKIFQRLMREGAQIGELPPWQFER